MKSLSHQMLDFCRSKPADEEYDFLDNCGGALFQFLSNAGYPVAGVSGYGVWVDAEGNRHQPGIDPEGDLLSDEPTTFGALASRLEAALGGRE